MDNQQSLSGTITPSGIFTALAEGTTTITAKNGSVSGNAIVIIRLSTSEFKNIENQGFESERLRGSSSLMVSERSVQYSRYEGTKAANIILGSSGSNIQLYQYGDNPGTKHCLSIEFFSLFHERE